LNCFICRSRRRVGWCEFSALSSGSRRRAFCPWPALSPLRYAVAHYSVARSGAVAGQRLRLLKDTHFRRINNSCSSISAANGQPAAISTPMSVAGVPFCGASRPPRDATRSLLGNIFGALIERVRFSPVEGAGFGANISRRKAYSGDAWQNAAAQRFVTCPPLRSARLSCIVVLDVADTYTDGQQVIFSAGGASNEDCAGSL
jgi:hypothetical protein